jgi:hypothetical protein
MRTTLLGHVVDTAKSVLGSLIAAGLIALGALATAKIWPPTISVSPWWLLLGLVVFGSLAGIGWQRARTYERVYEAWRDPMERTGGEIIEDADSSSQGKRVWHAIGGQDVGGAILFGPYHKLLPGTYLARFRIKVRLLDSANGHYWIGIAHSHGGSSAQPIPEKEHANRDDTRGRYEDRIERFAVTDELAKDNLEWRVRVMPGAEVWVDRILIRRCG